MDGQQPKPRREWRSFAKEYVIIVVGVLTALAAQQAAEGLRDHSRAVEARANIHSEIAFNLAEMNARQAIDSCIGKRLDEVDDLIAAGSTGKLPEEPIWIGSPGMRTMQDAKYQSALQSGAVSLFGDSEQATYSNIYSKFELFNRGAETEGLAWGDLRTLEKHPPPTASLDSLWRSAMQRARGARTLLVLTRRLAVADATSIGIAPERRSAPVARSACLPLHTRRDEAVKQITRMRSHNPGLSDLPIP